MSLGDELKRAAEQTDFDPPDGPYTVKVVDTYAGTARSGSMADFAKTRLQIIGGEHAGRQFDHFMSLSVNARPISAESLLLYGVDLDNVEDIDDLAVAIDNVVGTVAEVTVKHRGEFMNVNVGRVKTGQSDIPSDLPAEPVPPPANGGKQPTFEEMVGGGGSKADDDEIPY